MKLKKMVDEGFDEIFGMFKEDVILRNVTKSWDDDDNYEPTYSDSTIKAVIIADRDELSQEVGGEFNVGDAYAFVKKNINVKTDDQVKYNDKIYDVNEIKKDTVKGNTIFQELSLVLKQ